MRDVAIQFAKRGFRVLPCLPGSKQAALKNWESDSFEPLDVWERWPGEAYNVAIHGKGLAILDVDCKNGRDGLAQLAELPALPDTFTVRTPSGGLHLYFKLPEGVEVSNSARGLPSGFDVRGANGYALAPGATFDGKKYVLEKDAAPAPIPDWLLERLKNAPERALAAGMVIGELDTPEAIERARARILRAAPAVEGNRGNQTTYDLACAVLDFGISTDTAFELLQDWNDTCCPPWDDAELTRIIENALQYRQEAIGRDNPLAGLEVVHAPPNPFGAGVRLWERRISDFAAIPPRPWLADKTMLRGKITLLVAPGSVGKSLLTLQWAVSLALGPGAGEFCGLKPRERTNVLVVNMEDDLEEMEMRLAAVTTEFKLDENEVLRRVHLWSGQTQGQIPFVIARKDAKHGAVTEGEVVAHMVDYCRQHGIGALVIDPLVDTHECDENSNGEVQRVMRIYRRVASDLNAALVLVHHTKKPPAASSESYAGSADSGRGASAAVNAARVGFTLFSMSQKDGEKYNIPSKYRHAYARLDDAKANLFMASPDARWFKRKTVELPNKEKLGVLVPVQLSDGSDAEHKVVLEIMARTLSVEERYAFKTVAGKLAADPMFAGYSADGLVSRVIAACESGSAEFGGKVFQSERIGTKGAGTVLVKASAAF